jgi:hypothetical protein
LGGSAPVEWRSFNVEPVWALTYPLIVKAVLTCYVPGVVDVRLICVSAFPVRPFIVRVVNDVVRLVLLSQRVNHALVGIAKIVAVTGAFLSVQVALLDFGEIVSESFADEAGEV